MSEKNLLRVKGLSVEFGREKILDDLSFEVNRGEILTVLGPNGAGKTVLLKALLGLLPYSGEVVWTPDVKIGYVPQRLSFVKNVPLSVKEFFELKKLSLKKLPDTLKAVGLDESILAKNMGVVSSGQFQKILIAWGLLGDAEILLFDEPTAGVDIGSEETIYMLLSKLKKEIGLAVILVTHDMSIIYREATKVLCLNHKKICYGVPEEALSEKNLACLFGGDVKYYHHNHGHEI